MRLALVGARRADHLSAHVSALPGVRPFASLLGVEGNALRKVHVQMRVWLSVCVRVLGRFCVCVCVFACEYMHPARMCACAQASMCACVQLHACMVGAKCTHWPKSRASPETRVIQKQKRHVRNSPKSRLACR